MAFATEGIPASRCCCADVTCERSNARARPPTPQVGSLRDPPRRDKRAVRYGRAFCATASPRRGFGAPGLVRRLQAHKISRMPKLEIARQVVEETAGYRSAVVASQSLTWLVGRTDEEVAIALVQVADARFQEQLLREARRAGKVASGYRIPDRFRGNLPAKLDAVLAPHRAQGLFQSFPFGTDLTSEEVVLREALERLKGIVERKRLPRLRPRHFRKVGRVPERARPYLERMGLDAPRSLRERVLRRVLVYALASMDVI